MKNFVNQKLASEILILFSLSRSYLKSQTVTLIGSKVKSVSYGSQGNKTPMDFNRVFPALIL
ncbi:hypothetical protein Mic7113_3874 [Allocoleopsis franciscana PCC 7113]|uniref:Uncharacterized protein n=1 Tax=Allocoleopsis franciscana PCC 7113 TaxID=1173027 RepID=K9WIH1_9CYAN|nr:hypothetical protein Mic7113_3874 [Allocoleopsis franciscana PCC 7113]